VPLHQAQEQAEPERRRSTRSSSAFERPPSPDDPTGIGEVKEELILEVRRCRSLTLCLSLPL
jgi:hypothetical protein